MGVHPTCGCVRVRPLPNSLYSSLTPRHFSASFGNKKSSSRSSSLSYSFFCISGKFEFHGFCKFCYIPFSNSRVGGARRSGDLPAIRRSNEFAVHNEDDDSSELQEQRRQKAHGEFGDDDRGRGVTVVIEEAIPQGSTAIIFACFVGLFTGISVVLFNIAVCFTFFESFLPRGKS
ncbi:unnamed protein product [Ilex paraguariensis]|uniref:Uncharacterized protein n=1 Tax=Ilex paraguariensis TaxID=185542 RepID=A0ABC8RCZ6_9AQUA